MGCGRERVAVDPGLLSKTGEEEGLIVGGETVDFRGDFGDAFTKVSRENYQELFRVPIR